MHQVVTTWCIMMSNNPGLEMHIASGIRTLASCKMKTTGDISLLWLMYVESIENVAACPVCVGPLFLFRQCQKEWIHIRRVSSEWRCVLLILFANVSAENIWHSVIPKGNPIMHCFCKLLFPVVNDMCLFKYHIIICTVSLFTRWALIRLNG